MKNIFLFLALAVAVFAQEKQTVAVYVTGGAEVGTNEVLGSKLKEAITRSRNYVAVERTHDFLAQLQKEQDYQRSGNVDDNQLASLGKQSGARFVCVAELMPVKGGDFVNARLIDVETASIVATVNGAGQITSLPTLIQISENLAQRLLDNADSQKNVTERKRVAVYVTGGDDEDANKILGVQLVSAITESQKYSAMERTGAFLSQLQKEHDYQRSGNVNDDQLAKLGKQFGVDFVGAAKITSVKGSKYLTISLINVESAQVVALTSSEFQYKSLKELIAFTGKIAKELLRDESNKASFAPAAAQPAGQSQAWATETTPAPEQKKQSNIFDIFEADEKDVQAFAAAVVATNEAKEEAAKEETEKKKNYRNLIIGLGFDLLGVGLLSYGTLQNEEVKRHTRDKNLSDARDAESKRNIAYSVGAVALATGIVIHIWF